MLSHSPLVYLVIYVSDLAASRSFYESRLGFKVLEEDAVSVKYDAGSIIVLLNRAKDYGIRLSPMLSRRSELCWHTNNLDLLGKTLRKRGVHVDDCQTVWRSRIVLEDPDGYCLSVTETLTPEVREDWPAVTEPAEEGGTARLYLTSIALVGQSDTINFYSHCLGLKPRPALNDNVVIPFTTMKHYAAGKTTLTIGNTSAGDGINSQSLGASGLAPVFHTDKVKDMVDRLVAKGVDVSGELITESIGTIAQFADPSGQAFYLYQPSAQALELPSGKKIKEILSPQVQGAIPKG